MFSATGMRDDCRGSTNGTAATDNNVDETGGDVRTECLRCPSRHAPAILCRELEVQLFEDRPDYVFGVLRVEPRTEPRMATHPAPRAPRTRRLAQVTLPAKAAG